MAPDLLETIYEAALTPSRWPQALEQASRPVGAAGGQLLILDERSGRSHGFLSASQPRRGVPLCGDYGASIGVASMP